MENAQSAIVKACTIQFANDAVAALRHHNATVKNKRRCGKKKKEARKTFAVWIVIMLQHNIILVRTADRRAMHIFPFCFWQT